MSSPDNQSSANPTQLEDDAAKKARQEEFQQYLHNTGLMDCLTKILMIWYESNERPENPEEYLQDYFSKIDGHDINKIKEENEKLKERIAILESKMAEIEKCLEEDIPN